MSSLSLTIRVVFIQPGRCPDRNCIYVEYEYTIEDFANEWKTRIY